MKTNSHPVSLGVITILLLAVLLTLFLPAVNADNIQTLGSVTPGMPIVLKQNCVNVTSVNITSISVNGLANTQEIINYVVPMVLSTNGYQTYSFVNTSLAGEYVVTGICDENGVIKAWSYNFYSGSSFGIATILIYGFFFIVLSLIAIFSFRLMADNPMTKDELKGQGMYDLKKRNELKFYITLMKRKLWIVGLFGVYLSVLLLSSLFTNLSFNLGLVDLLPFLISLDRIMLWGLIPFVLFLLVYVILIFVKGTKDALKYQFGVRKER